jgi:thiamine-phosphate pyrophosphorylase
VANIPIPFVAIGGIKEHNIQEVSQRGARCFAMSTEIAGATDIIEKVNRIRDALAAR